jgi:hypothetical protein
MQLNGTCTIISPRQLRTFMRQRTIEEPSERDSTRNAEIFRRFGSVQAFVMGRVLRAGAFAQSYPSSSDYAGDYVRRPTFFPPVPYDMVARETAGGEHREDHNPGSSFSPCYYPYWYGDYPYYYYPEYMTQARVTIEVSMIRVSDGAVLYKTPDPVEGRVDLASPQRITPGSAALDAGHQAVVKVVKDTVPMPVTVTVNPQADIKTASGKTNGQWTCADAFRPTDERMYVVLQLPPTVGCDSFRLTVTPRDDSGEIVAARDFVWPIGAGAQAVEFSPKEIATRRGSGSYTVTLSAQDQQIMRHDFWIE